MQNKETTKSTVTARYLNHTNAATYLDISVRSLYRLKADKTFPYIKLGGQYHYDKYDLDAYMKSQKRIRNY
ncbi:helix-turn-helix domain-containing protein [Poriferisphaera sp. WC338]|uniref:helix-turn-helix domain-containing protein n=1 Tax=Poriferisphaera sp. WC338 TaxID=3425129 RepID=UPI003D814531